MSDVTNLKIDLCTEIERFRAMRHEWNSLLKRSQADNVFLTWEWLFTWWEIYGGDAELFIITVRDHNGEFVGLAPFKIRTRKVLGIGRGKVLEFIGTGGDVTSEYLDIIVVRGLGMVVANTILEYIAKNNEGFTLDLSHLRDSSSMVDAIKNIAHEKKTSHTIEQWSICPTLSLPTSIEAFYKNKSTNFRQQMGRYARVCQRDLNIHLILSDSIDGLYNDFDELIRLHSNRWGKKSRAFKTKEYVQFHKKITMLFHENGWLRLFFLRNKQDVLAGIYCFRYDHTYYYYQSGRNIDYAKHRLGTVILNRVISEAIMEGVAHFDFLTGSETYKYRWADSENITLRLRVSFNGGCV